MARTRRWLPLLVVLLPLHAGLAQAAMATSVHAGDPAPMAEEVPCHGESAPTPPGTSSHEGCCDLGACHCVAACGLCFSTVRVTVQRLAFEPPVLFLSVPAAAHPPDLRPPIA